MTTKKWTDAEKATNAVEELTQSGERPLALYSIGELENFDRAVSDSGKRCDRLIFKDGSSLILVDRSTSPEDGFYGRWLVDTEFKAVEHAELIKQTELELLTETLESAQQEINQAIDNIKSVIRTASPARQVGTKENWVNFWFESGQVSGEVASTEEWLPMKSHYESKSPDVDIYECRQWSRAKMIPIFGPEHHGKSLREFFLENGMPF